MEGLLIRFKICFVISSMRSVWSIVITMALMGLAYGQFQEEQVTSTTIPVASNNGVESRKLGEPGAGETPSLTLISGVTSFGQPSQETKSGAMTPLSGTLASPFQPLNEVEPGKTPLSEVSSLTQTPGNITTDSANSTSADISQPETTAMDTTTSRLLEVAKGYIQEGLTGWYETEGKPLINEALFNYNNTLSDSSVLEAYTASLNATLAEIQEIVSTNLDREIGAFAPQYGVAALSQLQNKIAEEVLRQGQQHLTTGRSVFANLNIFYMELQQMIEKTCSGKPDCVVQLLTPMPKILEKWMPALSSTSYRERVQRSVQSRQKIHELTTKIAEQKRQADELQVTLDFLSKSPLAQGSDSTGATPQAMDLLSKEISTRREEAKKMLEEITRERIQVGSGYGAGAISALSRHPKGKSENVYGFWFGVITDGSEFRPTYVDESDGWHEEKRERENSGDKRQEGESHHAGVDEEGQGEDSEYGESQSGVQESEAEDETTQVSKPLPFNEFLDEGTEQTIGELNSLSPSKADLPTKNTEASTSLNEKTASSTLPPTSAQPGKEVETQGSPSGSPGEPAVPADDVSPVKEVQTTQVGKYVEGEQNSQLSDPSLISGGGNEKPVAALDRAPLITELQQTKTLDSTKSPATVEPNAVTEAQKVAGSGTDGQALAATVDFISPEQSNGNSPNQPLLASNTDPTVQNSEYAASNPSGVAAGSVAAATPISTEQQLTASIEDSMPPGSVRSPQAHYLATSTLSSSSPVQTLDSVPLIADSASAGQALEPGAPASDLHTAAPASAEDTTVAEQKSLLLSPPTTEPASSISAQQPPSPTTTPAVTVQEDKDKPAETFNTGIPSIAGYETAPGTPTPAKDATITAMARVLSKLLKERQKLLAQRSLFSSKNSD